MKLKEIKNIKVNQVILKNSINFKNQRKNLWVQKGK